MLRYLVAYEVGRAVNPALVEGQLRGGAAQGIGGALLEEFCYDEAGQPQSATFMDYRMPTAAEVPPIDVLVTQDAPAPGNPLGVRGAGEGGVSARRARCWPARSGTRWPGRQRRAAAADPGAGAGTGQQRRRQMTDAERGRITRGGTAGERLVLDMRHLEPGLRDDAKRLDVHVGAGQQQALLGNRR